MKKISSSNYDEKYYLEFCGGFREFKNSFGKEFDRRNNRLIEDLSQIKGKRILDVGCGRGELIFWSVRNGASYAVGVDYSPAAIKIAENAKSKYPKNIKSRIRFEKMEATKLDFPEKSFDVVIYTDVHEHLFKKAAKKTILEIKRVLKDNGKLFFHSEPNKFFYDFAWRFWCYPISSMLIFVNKLVTKNDYQNIPKPSKVRDNIAKKLHVNEPTYFELKRLFKEVGLKGEIKTTNIVWIKPIISWKDYVYNALVYLDPVSRNFPLNVLFGQDFLAVLTIK